MGRTTSTAVEDAFIRDNYLVLPPRVMAARLRRSRCFVLGRMHRLGLVVPPEVIEERRAAGRFSSGAAPFNKGKRWGDFLGPDVIAKMRLAGFQKGNVPVNSLGVKDGDIRVRADQRGVPYEWVRVSKGRWLPRHQWLWAEAHGPQPGDHVVIFKDGNTLNCCLENLACIPRAELLLRNRGLDLPEDLKDAIRLLKKLNKAIHEKQYRGLAEPPVCNH
jgi:hypothetical protein